MIQIPDAPWIREAETIGYPVSEDYDDFVMEDIENDEQGD